jgi:hypothetical protein
MLLMPSKIGMLPVYCYVVLTSADKYRQVLVSTDNVDYVIWLILMQVI